MKVSVVIPVYNVQLYLHQCVDSVLGQTYKNLEVILVDDGSTDGCPAICDEYARMDSRVRVIHQANGGLSAARNTGIEHITGEYVMFLDGDDFWDDSKAVAGLVDRVKLTNVDVLNFSLKKYEEKNSRKVSYFSNSATMPVQYKEKNKQLDFISRRGVYISSACTKMIRRAIISDELLFERDAFSEDVVWSIRLLQIAGTMDYVDLEFYCYRQRASSISHAITDGKCRDISRHIIECVHLCENASEPDFNAMARYAAFQFCTFFIIQAQAEKWQGSCIKELKKYCDILKYHQNDFRMLILYVGTIVFGYERVCRGIRCIYRLKKR